VILKQFSLLDETSPDYNGHIPPMAGILARFVQPFAQRSRCEKNPFEFTVWNVADRAAFFRPTRLGRKLAGNDQNGSFRVPSRADDPAQQAFPEAWRSIKNLRSSGAFGSWLKRVAINIWLKHSRSKDPPNAVDDKPDVPAIVERSSIDEEIDLDRAPRRKLPGKPDAIAAYFSYRFRSCAPVI